MNTNIIDLAVILIQGKLKQILLSDQKYLMEIKPKKY